MPLLRRGALLALLALLALALPASPASAASKEPTAERATPVPLIFGHRGASGYRPEHTLASYALAARMGADYIEPDLVPTSDGRLVARHEPEISQTTDVADHPEFAGRRTTKQVDGVPVTGWFTEDFTLAELRTLRAKERIPAIRPRSTLYDGRYTIPTFEDVLRLRARLSRELGREIGVAPETKHPTFFRAQGHGTNTPLVRALRRAKLNREDAPVVVQSFETTNLKSLNRRIDVPLVQLLDSARAKPYDLAVTGQPTTYGDLQTPAGLRAIARYADVLGPPKDAIVPRDASGASLAPTTLVDDAHDAGLLVVPYTFRNENSFLPRELRTSADPSQYGRAFSEYAQFFALGVDGLFSDNPDTAVDARSSLVRR